MLKAVVSLTVAIFILTLPPASILASEFQIKIKPNSFEPTDLVIHQNDVVIFMNEDTIDRWPASNIHPTHQIYPEFDPKSPIKPKDSWAFKFKDIGEWSFHDHLLPNLTGKISVAGEKQNIFLLPSLNSIKPFFVHFYYQLFPQKLANVLENVDTYQASKDVKKLEYWLRVLGHEKYMDELMVDTGNGSKIDCHQEAHKVGRAAYEIYHSAVFQKINYNCHSGFLHGAMEAFIKEQGANNLTEKVEKLCQRFKSDFGKFECLHGIGHGFTAFVNYDIPVAIKLCGKLSDDYARRSCFGGVFMENIMVAEGKGSITGHQTKWVSEDPHFPCNGVDKSYLVQYECYQMQTSRMLHISSYNFPFLASECVKAPADMVPVCFRSMGRDIAGQTLRDAEKIITLCQPVPEEYFKECLTGALNVIIDFWGEDVKDQPSILCNKVSNPDVKKYCYSVLSDRLKNIFGDNKLKIKQICQMGEKKYYESCIGGPQTI